VQQPLGSGALGSLERPRALARPEPHAPRPRQSPAGGALLQSLGEPRPVRSDRRPTALRSRRAAIHSGELPTIAAAARRAIRARRSTRTLTSPALLRIGAAYGIRGSRAEARARPEGSPFGPRARRGTIRHMTTGIITAASERTARLTHETQIRRCRRGRRWSGASPRRAGRGRPRTAEPTPRTSERRSPLPPGSRPTARSGRRFRGDRSGLSAPHPSGA
jgi:hypothetical protein